MTISYKWLSEYLPVTVEPERLSKILTSIGLEVENLLRYEEVKGGLQGLVIGEVTSVEKHPNADKLTLTKVFTGNGEPLQIVCGAPNVAAGQKVVVAPVGSTIFPVNGDPVTLKAAKIRNIESKGMICAEDEIGLGSSHEGILVLPNDVTVGSPAADYFKPYSDWIFEIGLTPNRMDAMSHWGVARDVCAYLGHHDKTDCKPKLPLTNGFKPDNKSMVIDVSVENESACPRYSGLSISNIVIKDSPLWLQQRLKSIGMRPINNIVDITNFIQHETGQPLHAFDADALSGKKIIVKNLPEGTLFITLDEKERKLNAEDLMICDEKEGLCIAGVFGGLKSGVTEKTKNIFLESACFDPVCIRRTSFRHNLRTDAASRFEKGTDISATVNVLKRAAALIKEICGGEISSDIVDLYPQPREKTEVAIKYHYLKKLSGRNYHPDTVKNILINLGFEIIKDGIDEIRVAVPFHKTDITIPADIAEEILRIDGLDNVEIPQSILITPSINESHRVESYKEKVAGYLVGLGFYEIMTNSITRAEYFGEKEMATTIRMQNSLSAELNVMRPSMLETGLESVAFNLNRKNNQFRLFEFGKIYQAIEPGKNFEQEQLCLYITGDTMDSGWRNNKTVTDIYYLKGVAEKILQAIGITSTQPEMATDNRFEQMLSLSINGTSIIKLGNVSNRILNLFDIKQPVLFAEIYWDLAIKNALEYQVVSREISRFPTVHRDLAIIVDKEMTYDTVEKSVQKLKLEKLQEVQLFDIFESDKLGIGKKSMAISFTFSDKEKTLTDKEIDNWMSSIMKILEKEIAAEIRK